MYCHLDHYQEFSPSLKGVDHESWRNMTDQDKNTFVENLCDELAASADKWGKGPLDVPESKSIFDDGKSLCLNLLIAADARK